MNPFTPRPTRDDFNDMTRAEYIMAFIGCMFVVLAVCWGLVR